MISNEFYSKIAYEHFQRSMAENSRSIPDWDHLDISSKESWSLAITAVINSIYNLETEGEQNEG